MAMDADGNGSERNMALKMEAAHQALCEAATAPMPSMTPQADTQATQLDAALAAADAMIGDDDDDGGAAAGSSM